MTLGTLSPVSIFDISTHTLTWSVTIGFYSYGICRCISTHTLTWSVTQVLSRKITAT